MRIRNTERLARKLEALPGHLSQPIADALNKGVQEIRAHAVVNIQRHGSSGRTYQRGERTHTASAPGAFPNSDFGGLVSSIRSGMFDRFRAWVGTNLLYAKYLEFGTSRMWPRPFLRPSFHAKKQGIRERVRAAIKQALKGMSHA